MFILEFKKTFQKKYLKLIAKNPKLDQRVQKTLEILRKDPADSSIGSHKVQTTKFGEIWSSRVTGDIRILWNYKENAEVVILVISIGRHDQIYI